MLPEALICFMILLESWRYALLLRWQSLPDHDQAL